MNATRNLTPLTLIAATLAAAFLVQGARAETTVVQLEPVHVTAQRVPAARAAVAQLPLVEVSARRVEAKGLQIVQLPAVEVSASRSEATSVLAQQRTNAAPARNPA
jgi:hypothetical protein